MPDIDYRLPADRAEIDRFVAIAARALFFHTPSDDWVDDEGPDTFRMVTRDGELVGGMTWQRFGMWVGGRSVPCGGPRAVAIRPDARAGGVAQEMMRRNLVEHRELGFPLSALYPATHKVYRRAGYELAGGRITWKLKIDRVSITDRELTARPGTDADRPAMEALWNAFAARGSGQLDKHEWLWRRVLRTWDRKETRDVWIFEGDAGPEGYAVTEVKGSWESSDGPSLRVVDRAWTTGRAARRLLTLLVDHRSVIERASFTGPAGDPLLHAMPDRCYGEAHTQPWMLRIVDVPKALTARGWGPGRSGRLELRVADDVLPENDGRWTLEVGDGRALVAPGGSGALELDVRGLAALYTGFQSAEELAAAGLATGSERDLAVASSLFAGPAPWMNDAF